ncbi:MAG TPA: hypothetical protein VEX66_05645 [Microlunatus sp.]|jgi:hypothetical protein|nr:hypothetical protein [Microlunatus sp.]
MRNAVRRRGVRRGLIMVTLLGLLATFGGCSDPAAPDTVEVTAGRLTASRPAAWVTPVTAEAPWNAGFRLTPDSIEQIQFSGDFGQYATAAQAVGTLIGRAQVKLANFTVVETRDITVDGATTAQLVRYTITDNSGSQVFGSWIVAAHWPYPQSVAVSVLTPKYDPELERQVLSSLRMRPQLG